MPTADVYRAGNAPPAAPDVPAINGTLVAGYARGLERSEGEGGSRHFSHIFTCAFNADIRDDYDAGTFGANADTLFIPDKNGTPFKVVFVEFTPFCRRVFLARKQPTWPTTDL